MSDQKEQTVRSTCTRLEFILGDITKAEVDAIVNPTDLVLSGGGSGQSVDTQIHLAGGPEVDRACEEILQNQGGCQTGEAVITTAGNLSAKYIIHTVGPVWMGGGIGEAKLLESCYRECLQLAVENKIQSIAFPAISTGNYKYPLEKASHIVLTTVKEFVEQSKLCGTHIPELIQFYLFDEAAYFCYVKVFSMNGLRLSCLLE